MSFIKHTVKPTLLALALNVSVRKGCGCAH